MQEHLLAVMEQVDAPTLFDHSVAAAVNQFGSGINVGAGAVTHFDPFWLQFNSIVLHLNPFWPILTPFWAIWDSFWPILTHFDTFEGLLSSFELLSIKLVPSSTLAPVTAVNLVRERPSQNSFLSPIKIWRNYLNCSNIFCLRDFFFSKQIKSGGGLF